VALYHTSLSVINIFRPLWCYTDLVSCCRDNCISTSSVITTD